MVPYLGADDVGDRGGADASSWTTLGATPIVGGALRQMTIEIAARNALLLWGVRREIPVPRPRLSARVAKVRHCCSRPPHGAARGGHRVLELTTRHEGAVRTTISGWTRPLTPPSSAGMKPMSANLRTSRSTATPAKFGAHVYLSHRLELEIRSVSAVSRR